MSNTDHPVTDQNNQQFITTEDIPEDDLWSQPAKPSLAWYSGLSLKAFALSIAMILVSAGLLRLSWRINKPHESLSGFLSNVAAEFLLVGLAVVPTAWFARRKFARVAPYVVKFIAQLRQDGKITPDSARRAVICGVSLISDDGLRTLRSNVGASANRAPCLVCKLPVNVSAKCPHCHLKKALWDSDELRKINAAPPRLSQP